MNISGRIKGIGTSIIYILLKTLKKNFRKKGRIITLYAFAKAYTTKNTPQGIGRQLMQYAQTRAQETGHQLIWLDAMDQHPQAMNFYNSLGYIKGGLQHLDFELLHDMYKPMWYLYKHL